MTLNRELAATQHAVLAASGGGGEWHFAGRGSVNGRTLTFKLDRTGAHDRHDRSSAAMRGASHHERSGLSGRGHRDHHGDGRRAPDLHTGPGPGGRGGHERATPSSTDFVQCPGDTDGDAIIDHAGPGAPERGVQAPRGRRRIHQDGRHGGTELYTFGFNDVTGQPRGHAIEKGILNAHFPAPTLAFDEGDEVYLTLTNVGTLLRPDLFDPHSVHFHGFPNAGSVFDGVPESSITINQGFSFTYYYNIVEVGTFMYHCHVEAPEHMQMGMLGNLYVRPKQNGDVL